MTMLQIESDRISSILQSDPEHAFFAELYAAQQALAWTRQPTAFASPANMILREPKAPATGIPAGSGGCSAAPRHSES